MGGHNHMFAFFPERGSLMEDWEPVPCDRWRRVQLARFLISFPFALGARDVALVRRQMRGDDVGTYEGPPIRCQPDEFESISVDTV